MTTFGHTTSGLQDHPNRPRKPLTVKQILQKMSQLKIEGLTMERGTQKDVNLSTSDAPAKPGLLFLADLSNSGRDDTGQKK